MTDPKPLTPKQDAFLTAWLANGFNPIEAYMTAYNAAKMPLTSIRREAERVLNGPIVKLRLEELRIENPSIPVQTPYSSHPIYQNHGRPLEIIPPIRPDKVDKTFLLNATVDLWMLAKQSGNLAQVKSALELMGKITGDLVDRKELRVVRTWQDLTDAEINALAAGETIDATISDEEPPDAE